MILAELSDEAVMWIGLAAIVIPGIIALIGIAFIGWMEDRWYKERIARTRLDKAKAEAEILRLRAEERRMKLELLHIRQEEVDQLNQLWEES